jgi:hypothetical protein
VGAQAISPPAEVTLPTPAPDSDTVSVTGTQLPPGAQEDWPPQSASEAHETLHAFTPHT